MVYNYTFYWKLIELPLKPSSGYNCTRLEKKSSEKWFQPQLGKNRFAVKQDCFGRT